ncbi:hypothetical protein HO173_007094 [Letharia columbiana]|uniref:Cupin type-1 domain-containing protein n=1 Tax=Letharia columbiana TaxID=112416 RepID=A0A8H6FU94_9LECA|nr:uncharacterized protein HO173_007094 [Letharia columbiana]KAF6234874.1 hypothetical protein HO173_007094 [Letharia columbiana]
MPRLLSPPSRKLVPLHHDKTPPHRCSLPLYRLPTQKFPRTSSTNLNSPPTVWIVSPSSKRKAQPTPGSSMISIRVPTQIPEEAKGAGGQGDLANRKTFPALINLGVAASAGFMNPCGMNKPHIHPRATEFLILATGANVRTGFLLENGLQTQMSTTLSQYQGAILPQGSIHYEFNDNCEPAVFIAAFSNEDPGLSTVGKNFFSLDPDIVDADLGFPDFLDHTNIRQFAKSIPKSFSNGAMECLDRCHIKY